MGSDLLGLELGVEVGVGVEDAKALLVTKDGVARLRVGLQCHVNRWLGGRGVSAQDDSVG